MKQFVLKNLGLLDKVEEFIRRYTAILTCILLMFAIGIADSFYHINRDINDNLQKLTLSDIDSRLWDINRTLDNIKDAIRDSRY